MALWSKKQAQHEGFFDLHKMRNTNFAFGISDPNKLPDESAFGNRFTAIGFSGNAVLCGAVDDDTKGKVLGDAYVFERINKCSRDWQQKGANLKPKDLKANSNFGLTGDILGSIAVVSANNQDNKGAVYTYLKQSNNYSLKVKLQPNDLNAGDQFGASCKLDGSTLIIGAPKHNSKGAVYIYTTSDGGVSWDLQQKVTASNGESGDDFGISVDVSGDQALIGATGEAGAANATPSSGAVYAFSRSGSTWSEDEILRAGDIKANAFYGSIISLDGNKSAIGSPNADGVQANSGAVYLNSLSGSWSEDQKIIASDGELDDKFGSALDLKGDNLIVGAYGRKVAQGFTALKNNGKAYMFTNESGTWSEQCVFRPRFYATNSNPSEFSKTVFLHETDGTVVCGHPLVNITEIGISSTELFGSENSGSVEVFAPYDAQFVPLSLSDSLGGNPVGDIDGYLAVASNVSNGLSGTSFNSACYALKKNSGTGKWEEKQALFGNIASGRRPNLGLQKGSIHNNRIALPALYAQSTNIPGRVEVFETGDAGETWTNAASLLTSITLPDFDRFPSGDVRVHGDTVAVGHDRYPSFDGTNEPQIHKGRIYVFKKVGGNWTEDQIIDNPNQNPNVDLRLINGYNGNGGIVREFFGDSVQLEGDILVTHTIDPNTYSADQSGNTTFKGIVYVYKRADGNSPFVLKHTINSPVSNSSVQDHLGSVFGLYMTLSGDTLALSAHAKEHQEVYIYRTSDNWETYSLEDVVEHPDKDSGQGFNLNRNLVDDGFGTGLKLDKTNNNVLLVSAPFNDDIDNRAFNRGAAYIFQRNESNKWVLKKRTLYSGLTQNQGVITNNLGGMDGYTLLGFSAGLAADNGDGINTKPSSSFYNIESFLTDCDDGVDPENKIQFAVDANVDIRVTDQIKTMSGNPPSLTITTGPGSLGDFWNIGATTLESHKFLGAPQPGDNRGSYMEALHLRVSDNDKVSKGTVLINPIEIGIVTEDSILFKVYEAILS